jgi:hypothetical protein
VSVIASLFANVEPGTEPHARLCAKFVEDDHAKIDRLVELWRAYAARVENVQAAQRRSAAPGGALEGATRTSCTSSGSGAACTRSSASRAYSARRSPPGTRGYGRGRCCRWS